MIDILPTLKHWIAQGKQIALATVVHTWRSAPRHAGSVMAISDDLQIAGSVSGGCIEGEVVKAAQQVLANGENKLLRFGVSNEEAWQVGLTCGGVVHVFIESFIGVSSRTSDQKIWQTLNKIIQNQQEAVLITQLSEKSNHTLLLPKDTIGDPVDIQVTSTGQEFFGKKENRKETIGDHSYFFQTFSKPDHLIIIGAAHISIDLVQLATTMDFKITVIDPRGLFAERMQTFISSENLLRAWPEQVLPQMDLDRSVYGVLLTHDPKIDDQALKRFLQSDMAYIGALGSRKTHQKRK